MHTKLSRVMIMKRSLERLNDGWGERACVEVARRITFFIRRAPRVYLEVITGRWKRVARQRLLEYRPTGVHLGEPGFNALFSSLSIFSRRAYMHTRLGVTSKKNAHARSLRWKIVSTAVASPSLSLSILFPQLRRFSWYFIIPSIALSLSHSISLYLSFSSFFSIFFYSLSLSLPSLYCSFLPIFHSLLYPHSPSLFIVILS